MMLDGVPGSLVVAAVLLVGAGALTIGWLLRRLSRTLSGRELMPLGALRGLLALVVGSLLLAAGVLGLGLISALQSYRVFTHKTHIAEVQCFELGPAKMKLFYVPIEPDGARGATQTFDLDGDEWTVAGDVLRFRPILTQLGVETVHKVTRVEGRWLKAADATERKPTAYDIDGGTSATWLSLYKDGARGPLGWLVAGVHGQAVSQLPDRRAVYDIYVTPSGYVVDKRSL